MCGRQLQGSHPSWTNFNTRVKPSPARCHLIRRRLLPSTGPRSAATSLNWHRRLKAATRLEHNFAHLTCACMNNSILFGYTLHCLLDTVLTPYMQVRAFLQLGKTAGRESISVVVDVATSLMDTKGITPKFTIDELRDMVSQYNCGTRGQSRTFHQLNHQLEWNGEILSIKVPVIHLQVFPEDLRLPLARNKYSPRSMI